jgi:4-amino-4-deoxy-L-arabinose transferase-like glycosyltransferase
MGRIRLVVASSWAKRLLWGFCVLIFFLLRIQNPERDLQTTGSAALRDLIFTLLLWALFLILCYSIGMLLLQILHFDSMQDLKRGVFAFALGFGAITYWILLLAFLHLLNLTALVFSVVAAAILAAPEATDCVIDLRNFPRKSKRAWQGLSKLSKTILCVGLVIAGTVFINALSPAWDYDGLMYHLVGPKLFLEAGKIFPFSDNWYINGPFTIEMSFSLGLVFGDDAFPKLIHFSMGVLYTLASYLLARRILDRQGAWLCLALLMGIPTLPILSGFAYIDMGWSAFEVLSLLGLFIWIDKQERNWLILSGLMSGLAMGSKYLGLMGFGVLGLAMLVSSVRKGWRQIIRNIVWFGGPAILVASPWYLKNTSWFGNPVYPLYFGGPDWSASRLSLYQAYLQDFGHGRSLLDSIFLPLNIYIHHAEFGAVMNRIEIPNPLFLSVFLYPFLQKKRILSLLAAISLVRFVLWALGSQQTRFLLPIFPLLSILSVYVLQQIFSGRGRFAVIPAVLSVTLMAMTLYYQVIYTAVVKPFRVIKGDETKESFLLRRDNSYPAVAYAEKYSPIGDKVLMLGDGRGYYCIPQCIPDPDHFRWAGEIATLNNNDLSKWFSEIQVHYIAISREDLDFLLQHDPFGVMEQAVVRMSEWRDTGCLEEVFNSEWVSLYEITCK